MSQHYTVHFCLDNDYFDQQTKKNGSVDTELEELLMADVTVVEADDEDKAAEVVTADLSEEHPTIPADAWLLACTALEE